MDERVATFADNMLVSWMQTLIDYVRSGEPDLTNRQMALLLVVYLKPGPHTVRGLARALNVSKPVVTRALNRLGALGYLRRQRDDSDRATSLSRALPKGLSFLKSSGSSLPATAWSNPPQRRRLALKARSTPVDPRTHAVRGSLVDIRLADQVFAPHYAVPSPYVAIRRQDVLVHADEDATVLSEILAGETFEVLELSSEWAWGRCAEDGSVGYVARDGLSHGTANEQPSVMAVGTFVEAVERLVSAPVRPGGRSRHGVDAAGLVFLAMRDAGIHAPRFLEHQQQLGRPVEAAARGDLIFFDRHVAIAIDDAHVVHAGRDAVERVSLFDLVERLGPVVERRRIG